jgi:hypothetical protein
MISVGGYHLPVPLHRKDNCDPGDRDTCDPRNNGDDCGCSAGSREATEVCVGTPGGADAKPSDQTAKVNGEGDSYSKVNRGDKTAIELFLAGIRGWEAGLRHQFDGDRPKLK